MAINASGAVAVPLTVFGSWVTEVAPQAVPENISPDCGDVAFAPGQVGSRPCTDIMLNSPFPAGGPAGLAPTVVSGHSFVTPTYEILNLYFDSNGVLWQENLTNSPDSFSRLLQSVPGSFARFCSSFGRCYIAISDGLHGADIPLQYDGVNIRRVTQNGPGLPPSITCITLPTVSVATASASYAIAFAEYASTGIIFFLAAPVSTITFGTFLTVTGNNVSAYNISGFPFSIGTNALGQVVNFALAYSGSNLGTGTGGTVALPGGVSLSRNGNLVVVNTASAHGLKVGYQAQLQNNGVLICGTAILSIVINNEQNPGLATITTQTPHGLVPENDVTITGVLPASVGGSWAASWNGSVTTMTSSIAHNLVPGAVITVTGGTGTSAVFNTAETVALTPSPTQISFDAAYLGTAPLTASSLTVSISWPVPDNTPAPIYFEVQACPTSTTFQVQVTYTDGTWASGSAGFSWDGIFYVASVPTANSFTYQQYGPAGSTTETTGTVTPFGQAAPGLHLISVAFLTDQGAVTAPSPFAIFIANGGQYLNISSIPLGPSNVIARILMFTGAQPTVPGELPPFYYIPTTPQLEGQIVGTSTVVNDNTTTSITLDFADDTLYAATGASIPGNNLANQIVLDGALGFAIYDSRLTTWGQRNYVQNLLNMGFEGGVQPNAPNFPAGWNSTINTQRPNQLTAYRFGDAWQITVGNTGTRWGEISQGAYQDCYGDPILSGNTNYSFRLWVQTNGGPMASNTAVFVILSSASTGFNSSVLIPITDVISTGGYVDGDLSAILPVAIPIDLTLYVSVYGSSTGVLNVTLDEMGIFPTLTPYTDGLSYASYINNPEGIDGDSGQFGADDPSKLMDMAVLRDTLYLLTQAPTGRLHETNGSSTGEPSSWDVNEVAANCGTVSAFGLTHSQADDTAASGGDDWMAWPSDSGVYIFGGGLPEKISQEIQPNWNDPTKTDTAVQINFAAATSIWGLCDPVARLLYFGVPIGAATAPNKIYVLDFKNLGSAQAIAGSPPFHPSFSGKLIATDNSRKWAPWNLPMNGGSRMYRGAGQLEIVLFGGNGQTLGAAAGYGNIYTLNPALLTDDDYGQIYPYYTTYFFVDPEKAQALGLKGVRILMAYLQAYIQGTGQIAATYFADDLANPWSLSTTRTLTSGFFKDRQFGGGMCTADRIAVRFASSPITGTDNGFVMSRLTAYIKNAKLSVSGVNQ